MFTPIHILNIPLIRKLFFLSLDEELEITQDEYDELVSVINILKVVHGRLVNVKVV